MFSDWETNGFGVIAPARPGYGRTPLGEQGIAAEAADLLAALLDTLGIEKVIVNCVSGGGPTGIWFAIRHPQKTQCLITECALTGNYDHPSAAELSGAMTKWMATSVSFARTFAWYYSTMDAESKIIQALADTHTGTQ